MARRPNGARRRPLQPTCESLESRALLSSTALQPGLGLHAAAAIRAAEDSGGGTTLFSQFLSKPALTVSTVPANGDVNPYGVAFVPQGFPTGGTTAPGDILVSNFNAKSNLQGTGTTIVSVAPDGTQSLFFQAPRGQSLGLTTALGVLRRGFVIVGNLPSTDGTSATAQQGSLLILDRSGNEVANLTDSALLNGPWDLTVRDLGGRAQVFVSNVLSGTVTRLDLRVSFSGVTVVGATQIGSGYTHRGDPNAFELGPTGLAYDPTRDALYVASTADNAIFVIPRASRVRRDFGTGRLVTNDPHLHGPLGLTLGPRDTLIVANGDAINTDATQSSEISLFTRRGQFLSQQQLDPKPDAAFGIALKQVGRRLIFAAVNDNQNTLEIFNGSL